MLFRCVHREPNGMVTRVASASSLTPNPRGAREIRCE
jgi:hypothetical protein